MVNLSIITPAFNEESNLPLLCDRLTQVLDAASLSWEWIVIDDHSQDNTYQVLQALAAKDPRVYGYRLSHNFGSHAAITCGFSKAKGEAMVVIAGDLQDPPELIPVFADKWRAGYQIVWAVRGLRHGEKKIHLGFSNAYYWMLRHFLGFDEVPSSGSDFFLIDRRAADAFLKFRESNTNIFILISQMGFRQIQIPYDKGSRVHGASGWTWKKKIRLVIDTIISYNYFPIRLMAHLGIMIAFIGTLYACFIIFNHMRGEQPEGWASLMVVILILGGIQMLMVGVLGEYLWRALDEIRGRPKFLIEASTDDQIQDR